VTWFERVMLYLCFAWHVYDIGCDVFVFHRSRNFYIRNKMKKKT
jgi:hypothetical protein